MANGLTTEAQLESMSDQQILQFIFEKINETPVLRLRNRLLPLVNLRDVLGLNAANANGEDVEDGGQGAALVEELEQSTSFIVVSQVGNYTFGIVVDKVFDTEEIVVKPVAPILRDISVFSGNTILGDGSVIMILDPNGIADTTGEISVPDADKADEAPGETWDAEQVALLVFKAGSEEPKAVPLALIARLEEIDVDTIETSDNELVVQYRGKLMPLVKLDGDYDAKTTGRRCRARL